MRRRWLARVVIPVILIGAFAAVMTATDHELNLGYLAAATAVGCAALWLAVDLVPTVPYTTWKVSAVYTPRQPGSDVRLDRLTDRLTSGVDREAVAHDVHRALTGVVDERLLRNHGITRTDDPEGAERLLGPELTRYLNSPPQLRRSGGAQEYAALLDRIEEL